MRVLWRIALLVVLWLLAWGDLSVANVLSGVAVAVVTLVAFPPDAPTGRRVRLRPVGVVRLAGYVLAQLFVSNVLMTRQLLSRRPDVRPGVLAHRLAQPSEEVVTLMTSIIALSPGTMVADVDPASTTVYVHFFRIRDVAAARAALERLERHVTDAISVGPAGPTLPTPEETT
jgi:multicomponent Na+:H+ antiporter subunit E